MESTDTYRQRTLLKPISPLLEVYATCLQIPSLVGKSNKHIPVNSPSLWHHQCLVHQFFSPPPFLLSWKIFPAVTIGWEVIAYEKHKTTTRFDQWTSNHSSSRTIQQMSKRKTNGASVGRWHAFPTDLDHSGSCDLTSEQATTVRAVLYSKWANVKPMVHLWVGGTRSQQTLTTVDLVIWPVNKQPQFEPYYTANEQT